MAVEVKLGAVFGSTGVLEGSPGFDSPVMRSGVPLPSSSPSSCPLVKPSPSESAAARAGDQKAARELLGNVTRGLTASPKMFTLFAFPKVLVWQLRQLKAAPLGSCAGRWFLALASATGHRAASRETTNAFDESVHDCRAIYGQFCEARGRRLCPQFRRLFRCRIRVVILGVVRCRPFTFRFYLALNGFPKAAASSKVPMMGVSCPRKILVTAFLNSPSQPLPIST